MWVEKQRGRGNSPPPFFTSPYFKKCTMESIIRALSDPGAWISGILFGLISSIISNKFGTILEKIRKISRATRLKIIREIRTKRNNPMEISFYIAKSTAHFIVFILLCFFYLGTLIYSDSLRAIINYSWLAGIVIGTPIFLYEIVWPHHDSFAKKLTEEHGKLLKYLSSPAWL